MRPLVEYGECLVPLVPEISTGPYLEFNQRQVPADVGVAPRDTPDSVAAMAAVGLGPNGVSLGAIHDLLSPRGRQTNRLGCASIAPNFSSVRYPHLTRYGGSLFEQR